MRYENIEISDDGLREIQDGRVVASVRLEEVITATLFRGSGAQMPASTFILGMVLIAIGAAPWVSAYLNGLPWSGNAAKGTKQFGTGIMMMAFFLAPIGSWLLHHSLKRRWVISVVTKHGEEKFVFSEAARHDELLDFAAMAASSHGIRIDA
jgi:hypothetical protein